MTAAEIRKEMEMVQAQQEELVFEDFNHEEAWKLGNLMVQRAREQRLPVGLSITFNRQSMFYCALPGSAPTNEHFIERKDNVVYECYRSSYEMTLAAALETERDFMEYWGMDYMDFALAGGSFPITVRGSGVLGTVTCSGLAQEEDHRFVVSVLKEYLGKQGGKKK